MGFFQYVGRIFGYNGNMKEQNQRIIALEKSVEELMIQSKSMRTQVDQLTSSFNHLTIAHMQLVNDMGIIYASLKAIAEGSDHDPYSLSMLGYGNDDDDGGLPN
jgi:hypothetical protein